MQTRPLGRTGYLVTPLGLGLAALGRPGYINLGHADDLHHSYDQAAMAQHAHDVLDSAFAGGMRYFDAARSYGAAEAFLASWLRNREVKPEEVVIASKWGYTYTADWRIEADRHEVKDHSLAVLRRQVEETRAHLGPYLNLYQIHSATLDSGVLNNAQVLRELADLRQAGWKIGLTLTGPKQAETLRQAMTIEIDGVRLFDTVQATWNLLEPSCGTMLAEAHAAGMGVIVKEALANGRLSQKNDDLAFASPRRLLESTAARLGCSLDALALAAVLARPWVDVVLSGAATPGQVRANMRALDVVWDEEAEAFLAALAEPAEEYWRTRASLPWN